MSLSRRFLSLIVGDRRNLGAKSLCCLDLTRHKLFDRALNGTEQKLTALPKPSFSMGASDVDLDDHRIHCFPAVESRVFCLDQAGRGLLLEADTSRMVMLPPLHKPKLDPISLYIPCADKLDDLDGGGGGTLFVMDRVVTNPEVGEAAGSPFEALVYRKPGYNSHSKSWDCDLIPPPPPYTRDAGHGRRLEISSYAVVNGGSQICVSVAGVGTYCMDTSSYAWSEVGEWTLPFHGKVEYVPEFKLWFGFSAENRRLVAADLSAMDSGVSQQPQLLDSWMDLGELRQGWEEVQDPQLVSLGSGRFCIARFLKNTGRSQKNVTTLAGAEVAASSAAGKNLCLDWLELGSRFHKSRCGEDAITAVF